MLPLSTHVLFGLRFDSFKFFSKALVIVISFHSFFLNEFLYCISVRSAPQILFIKDEHTFLFLNFLTTGLCNSSANFLLKITSVLVAPSRFICKQRGFFYTKKSINHWSKSTLLFIIFWIFSNIKSFITQYFIRSCSSS